MEANNGGTKIIDGVVYQAVSPASVPTTAESQIVIQPKVEVGESPNGEIEFNFERVDMQDPFSILSYGNDVQKEICAILDSTAQMTVCSERTFLNDDMLAKVVSFEESLDDAKKRQAQEEGLLKRLAKSILLKANNQQVKKEEEMKTYQGRYKDYTENLNLVAENVSQIARDALSDIQLRKEITKQLTPIIAKLDAMVKAGREDREKYDLETLAIGQEDQSPDTQAIVSYRTQQSNVFLNQLNGLEKAVVLYKGQIQQYQIQQNNSMIAVQQAHDFVTNQKSVLQSLASVQILNKQDTERLNSLASVSEAANIAITQGAAQTAENARLASELALNGGFTMDSIESVMNSINEGVSIIASTKELLLKRNHAEEEGLARIQDQLEANKQNILSLIEDQSSATLALEEKENKGGYQRRLSSSFPSINRPKIGR